MTKSNTSRKSLQEDQPCSARPLVSVIVVSWNVRQLLETCLHSILSPDVSGNISTEIIVIDNASRDGSVEAVRAFSGVRIIRNERNCGYGIANNQGMERANGEYLLIANPDAEMLPGSLEALVTFADAHPRAGLIAPRLLNPDGTVQSSAFRFPTLRMAVLDLFPLPMLVPGRIRIKLSASKVNGRYSVEQVAKEPFRVDHPLGACMLIRRQAYEDCGGFDPAIFMYSEEVDLAMRYGRAGWECWQVPQARVVHHGGASTRQLPQRMMIELWRSRFYIYRKHHSRLALRCLAMILLLAQLVRTLGLPLALLRGSTSRAEAARSLRLGRALTRLALQQL